MNPIIQKHAMKRKNSYNIKMNLPKKILLSLFFILSSAAAVFAVSASPNSFQVSQPDGESLSLTMRGDEFYHWTEDSDGYTVIRDTKTKEWFYARQGANGRLEKSDVKASGQHSSPAGFSKHLKDTDFRQTADSRRKQMMRGGKNAYKQSLQLTPGQGVSPGTIAAKSSLQRSGTQRVFKNLVILVAFSDKNFVLSNPIQTFDDFYNKPNYTDNGAKGSVYDYYNAASYGQLQVQSVVTGISTSAVVTLSNTSGYYAGTYLPSSDPNYGVANAPQMVLEALQQLNAQHFDFTQFDPDGTGSINYITVLHAGGGMEAGVSNAIWSHKWELTAPFTTWDGETISVYDTIPELRGSNESAAQISRIGTAAHELGHAMLDLPDLYDTTYASYGVGDYCLMGGGSWNGPAMDGSSPALLCAWSKYYSGFITPVEITSSSYFSIPAAATDGTAFYKFSGPQYNAKEYYLVENRQGVGFDYYIPSGQNKGILIWHIDERQLDNGAVENDPSHYLVDLKEADGSNGLAKNLMPAVDSYYYRSGNNTSFTNATNPNSIGWDGYPANIALSEISATASTMTFRAYLSMQITGIDISTAIKGVSENLTITGSNFVDGSSVSFTRSGSTVAANGVTFVNSSSMSCSVAFSSDSPSGPYDLNIVNSFGDRAVMTGAITVYSAPQATSLSSGYILLSSTVSQTALIGVNGTDFVGGYTNFYLQNDVTGNKIYPSVNITSLTRADLTFDANFTDIGGWTVYISPQAGIAASPTLQFSITESTSGMAIAPSDADVEMLFPVQFANGIVGTGSALIRSGTFDSSVVMSANQDKTLVAAGSVIQLNPTDLGVDLDAQGKQPSKTILLKIPYNASDISQMKEDSLVLARYSPQNNIWIPILSSKVDKQNKYVSAELDHLSTFAIMGVAAASSLDSVVCYPNPIVPSKGSSYSKMTIANLPPDAQITVYSISGEKVAAITPSGSIAVWNAVNLSGNQVASGVYLLHITDGAGGKKTFKIAVER